MALRPIDNALPIAVERTKKVTKVAVPATAKATAVPNVNDENSAPPPKGAEQSVEYIRSEDLAALQNPKAKIANVVAELDSKDWIKACEALNDARRLAIHHSSLLLPILEKVMIVIVKTMKNPRSALCKTSIMACSDIFHSFGHLMLSSSGDEAFDKLLLQLLLKASQDKKFVCEEAEKALREMATSMCPLPLLKKLKSYVNHSNLRVRAKAAFAMSNCVSRMDIGNMKEFGLVAFLQMAAELLNDRLPEAREAARSIVNSIFNAFTKEAESNEGNESSTAELWENFCCLNLPPISAQAVAKIISH